MIDEREEIEPEESFDVEGTAVAVGSGEGEDSVALDVPDVLPVLPLKNTVLFPHLLSPLLVSSKRSQALIDSVALTPQRLLVCVPVRHRGEGSPGPGDLYS
jgi:ATP-dependent Lon protease